MKMRKRRLTTFRKENGVFGLSTKPSNFYYNKNTRYIIYFDKITGDFITGDKFRKEYFKNVLSNNNISTLNSDKKN
jgi:hypothetical protein